MQREVDAGRCNKLEKILHRLSIILRLFICRFLCPSVCQCFSGVDVDVCVHQRWSQSVDLMIKHISTLASWSRSPAEPGVWGVSTRSMLVHVDKSGRKEPGITCTRSRFTLNQSVKIIYNNLIIICGSSNNSSFQISKTNKMGHYCYQIVFVRKHCFCSYVFLHEKCP